MLAKIINTAVPPVEVTSVLKAQRLPDSAIEGWVAVPAISPPSERLAMRDIQEQGQIDVGELLRPFLGNPLLDETLRTVDILNGCGHRCDTCLADSAFPSRIFSLESLQRLFVDERFIKMLQPDSLRLGSSGDILDHPHGVEIVRVALQGTESLDAKRLAEKKERHKVKVFTNYRPSTEVQINELLNLARINAERVDMCISLPFNSNDAANRKFSDFVKSRPDVFREDYPIGEDTLTDFGWGSTKIKNVSIQDVRHPRLLFMTGRVLSEEANAGRVPKYDYVMGDRETSFAHRGLVKVYLNPDALWLMVYATPYESHTIRVFTPITTHNLEAISYLPYHPDFPTPPNWPGGRGKEKPWDVAKKLKAEVEVSGKPIRPLSVVS